MPAVTELVIAELLYLQYSDPRLPTYVYVNSTGTSRADGETVSAAYHAPPLPSLVPVGEECCWGLQVGMETEGFAIYDTMMLVKNSVRHAQHAAVGDYAALTW